MLSGISPVIQELYGIRVRTPWPVPNVSATTTGPWDVEFVEGSLQIFTEAANHIPAHQADWWTQNAALPDGARYCRWTNLFEFVVPPDGRSIQVRALRDASLESLQACLLVDALSFSMVRLGREPLHATAVLTDHGGVAFLGESGCGKSTLGAQFIRSGCPLIADDMLVLTPNGDHFLAHPGPPRIKLYRDVALDIFGSVFGGVPMNPMTEKLIIPLDSTQAVQQPVNLLRLYLLANAHEDSRSQQPAIGRLSPAQALPRILAACATHWTYERDRLKRQFSFVTRLVQDVPVKTLTYVRDRKNIGAVRDAVLADLVE
jgi:hypothetical protein